MERLVATLEVVGYETLLVRHGPEFAAGLFDRLTGQTSLLKYQGATVTHREGVVSIETPDTGVMAFWDTLWQAQVTLRAACKLGVPLRGILDVMDDGRVGESAFRECRPDGIGYRLTPV